MSKTKNEIEDYLFDFLEKSKEELQKGLFAEKEQCVPMKETKTKENVFWSIKSCINELKEMKDNSYFVENNAEDTKKIWQK